MKPIFWVGILLIVLGLALAYQGLITIIKKRCWTVGPIMRPRKRQKLFHTSRARRVDWLGHRAGKLGGGVSGRGTRNLSQRVIFTTVSIVDGSDLIAKQTGE